MTTMSLSQARVVDPVLTKHARGYKHPARVGGILFPTVEVPEIDLGMRAVNVVMNSLTLGAEIEQAQLAVDAANYDAAHKIAIAAGSKWSSADGDPVADIETGQEAVRASIGMDPNVAVIGSNAYRALKNNPVVVDRFKYTGQAITTKMIADLFELETVAVAKAVYADEDDQFQDVWGNNMVLAYAPQTPSGHEEPSFGYTYTLKGHPIVETPYWHNDTKSWIYGVTHERSPVLTGMAAGYLIQNPA